ncbi:hypothetical protein [Streptomyces bohaiensis]|nr:hypothetical protein [Streptomyces bohaiensis]
MHPSEPFRPQQPGRHRHIPGMRPSFEPAVGHSATPIYDALCAEYRRMFRTLPGDRSGEEELRFDAFGTFGSPRTAVAGWHDPGRRHGSSLPALPPGRHGRTDGRS